MHSFCLHALPGETFCHDPLYIHCRNAILDTDVSIGNDVSITNMYGVKESDRADTGGFIIQARHSSHDVPW